MMTVINKIRASFLFLSLIILNPEELICARFFEYEMIVKFYFNDLLK